MFIATFKSTILLLESVFHFIRSALSPALNLNPNEPNLLRLVRPPLRLLWLASRSPVAQSCCSRRVEHRRRVEAVTAGWVAGGGLSLGLMLMDMYRQYHLSTSDS